MRILSGLAVASLSATQAGAVEHVNIDVVVQEIAVISVVEDSASTTVTDSSPTYAGDPSPVANTDDMAHLELMTNYCVDGVEFEFDTVSNIRPDPGAFYGQAVGQSTGNTLGTLPFVRYASGVATFGNFLTLNGSPVDAPLTVSGTTGGFCGGVHDIYIGLVTRWDFTLPGEPHFAAPDTYTIPITATLSP
ncbi:hypothetical protein [Roseovarius salis]|uniref:hypothetical protein n=1 Tax=Roseovarius salis TaxID=3376063 RepID=UPI0037C5D497